MVSYSLSYYTGGRVGELENIDKSIQKQDILQGITLEVSPQKLTAFIGPNGAGKSTLLSIMSRLDQERSGNSQYQRS